MGKNISPIENKNKSRPGNQVPVSTRELELNRDEAFSKLGTPSNRLNEAAFPQAGWKCVDIAVPHCENCERTSPFILHEIVSEEVPYKLLVCTECASMLCSDSEGVARRASSLVKWLFQKWDRNEVGYDVIKTSWDVDILVDPSRTGKNNLGQKTEWRAELKPAKPGALPSGCHKFYFYKTLTSLKLNIWRALSFSESFKGSNASDCGSQF